MATSPPYNQSYNSALSPPIPTISIPQPPKRRQTDMPTSAPSIKRRKASMMSTTSSSSHPLRQTSFPPEQPHALSRVGRYSRSPSMDTMSVVSGSAMGGTSKKRKRKSGRERDATSVKRDLTPDEDEEGGDQMAVEMVARTIEEKQKEQDQKNMLVRGLDPDQFARYEAWRVSKLADSVVRRIINQTLSQSAPASVILAVRTAAKIFAGEMVGGAVRVQKEWIAATGERQTLLPDEEHERGDADRKEKRRGPLVPDHLREAIRRYRAERAGGLAGQLNLYQNQASTGVERFGVRFGGKRMLR